MNNLVNSILYANAVVSANENKILDKNKIQRLLDCASVDETKKILVEAGFADLEVEEMLLKEEERVYEFLKSYSPSKEITSCFLKKADYHNAKALVKAKYAKVQVEDILKPTGNIEVDKLKDYIFQDLYAFLPKPMSKALLEIDNAFSVNERDYSIIDILLTKAMHEDILSLAKENKTFSAFFSADIDLKNILIALRAKKFDFSASAVEAQFIQGGTLPLADILSVVTSQIDMVLEIFKFSPYNKIVKSAIEDYAFGGGFTRYEKESDNYLLSLLKKSKNNVNSLERFYSFILGRQYEIKNAKIIVSGIESGLEKEKIKLRLRETYD